MDLAETMPAGTRPVATVEAEHPSDWRWNGRMLRWQHPHARSTITVIEPAKAPEHREPNSAFGFARELAAAQPLDADGTWEGMGL